MEVLDLFPEVQTQAMAVKEIQAHRAREDLELL